MTKKRGLGRGLQALIPNYSDEEKKTLKNILVTDIKPNPKQPRKEIDKEKLSELAKSIKEHGVIQPIVVRGNEKSGYQLIAGERRWRACLMIGQETIPAVIATYNDGEAAEVALIENLQRENLNPIEEAIAYQSLIKEFGLTQEQVADRVGKSRSLIANMLRLLTLSENIIMMLNRGEISTGHARALLAIEESHKQIAAAKEVAQKQLSVRETEQLVKKLNREQKPRKGKSINPELVDLQDQLQRILGTKVQIKSSKKGKGKLEIEFYSEEDLTRIIDLVVGRE
ncbi:ParB/RepB/Spo0J family partition protein [Desulfofalx alkaliphila]|uniref:ParB/RepB/Spo0J family partition protein n=1 Tax=Desulfofalx alkaliphila TaxID=105483 RepID=UPI0004E1E7A6|nr:ParB/RepB/Spo0J family partition protein [Desulfofalx alkaliphila]